MWFKSNIEKPINIESGLVKTERKNSNIHKVVFLRKNIYIVNKLSNVANMVSIPENVQIESVEVLNIIIDRAEIKLFLVNNKVNW